MLSVLKTRNGEPGPDYGHGSLATWSASWLLVAIAGWPRATVKDSSLAPRRPTLRPTRAGQRPPRRRAVVATVEDRGAAEVSQPMRDPRRRDSDEPTAQRG